MVRKEQGEIEGKKRGEGVAKTTGVQRVLPVGCTSDSVSAWKKRANTKLKSFTAASRALHFFRPLEKWSSEGIVDVV